MRAYFNTQNIETQIENTVINSIDNLLILFILLKREFGFESPLCHLIGFLSHIIKNKNKNNLTTQWIVKNVMKKGSLGEGSKEYQFYY